MSAEVRDLSPARGRVPPQALDAERSLLGALLLAPDALPEVQLAVAPADFYRAAHGKLFEAICTLASKGEPFDRVTLKGELQRQGVFESVGGEDFVDVLDKVVPVAANAGYYARLIAEKALLRRAIEASAAMTREAFEQEGDVREFLDRAEARVFALRSSGELPQLSPLRSLLKPTFDGIQARYERDTTLTGLSTGLDALDEITCGLQPGDLVLIGGRPSMGKTSLGLDFARAIALAGGAVVVFSLEMPKEQLALRLLSMQARVSHGRLRTGKMHDSDWAKLAQAGGELAACEIHIDDQVRGVMPMRAIARRYAAQNEGTKHPLRAIVVDYLQLMDGVGGEERREQEVARNSRELKGLAKQLRVPVIALSQLNRDLEKRQNRRPQLSDLRESGTLEQDADLILFPYRGEVYGDKDVPPGQADIIVAKQRNGPLGDARVAFVGEFMSFANLRPDNSGSRQASFLDEPSPHTDENRHG